MFSPLLVSAVGSILKRLLQVGAAYLVARGVWSAAESGAYVEALSTVLSVALLTAVYAAYDKWLKPRIVRFLSRPEQA